MDPYRAVQRTTSTTFWHGGVSGLSVGDELISRYEQRERGRRTPYTRGDEDDETVVYITDHPRLAWSFAAMNPADASDVYEVRPIPPSSLAIDPDFLDVGLTCTRARIVAIAERGVRMTFEEAVRIVAPYLTWTNGARIYTPDGLLTIAPTWPRDKAAELASLGPWLPHRAVRFNPQSDRFELHATTWAWYLRQFPELGEQITVRQQ